MHLGSKLASFLRISPVHQEVWQLWAPSVCWTHETIRCGLEKGLFTRWVSLPTCKMGAYREHLDLCSSETRNESGRRVLSWALTIWWCCEPKVKRSNSPPPSRGPVTEASALGTAATEARRPTAVAEAAAASSRAAAALPGAVTHPRPVSRGPPQQKPWQSGLPLVCKAGAVCPPEASRSLTSPPCARGGRDLEERWVCVLGRGAGQNCGGGVAVTRQQAVGAFWVAWLWVKLAKLLNSQKWEILEMTSY